MYAREYTFIEQMLNSLQNSSWISWCISVLIYVFTAWSLYTIARRRGLHSPWLAWIPFGRAWLLGSLSDQYRYVVRGQVCSKRKSLLALSIANFVLSIIGIISIIIAFASMIIGTTGMIMAAGDLQNIIGYVLTHLGSMLILVILWAAVAVSDAVFGFIALYDVYISCDPGNGVLYLVLSIFLSFLKPVFLFICRNKDYGMPPRRPQPSYRQPVYRQSTQPQSNSASDEPVSTESDAADGL